jgi:GNAT superfamily N-acetyltransferase
MTALMSLLLFAGTLHDMRSPEKLGVSRRHAMRVERASLHSWPALSQLDYDGWVLRFAGGYTKRANSVTSLGRSSIPLPEKIARCEREYSARGLPCVFRLTPMAHPASLDQALARRGYAAIDRTLVLACRVPPPSPQGRAASALRIATIEQWLEAFSELRGLEDHWTSLQREIVERIETPLCPLLARNPDGSPVGYALGVAHGTLVGVFGLYVAPAVRRQGVGRHLLERLLAWSAARRCRTAYLQVMEENADARRLYERFGFRMAYPYWYRTAPVAQTGEVAWFASEAVDTTHSRV